MSFNLVFWKALRTNDHKWPIDFYIKTKDLYIQVDGKYWHGLDQDIKKIQESRTPHDKKRFKQFMIDREQEKWFKENKMTLIRISDTELYSLSLDNLLEGNLK